MTTFAQLDRARSRHRAIAMRALLAIAVLVPSCVLFIQVWDNHGRDIDAMTTGRHGAAYVGAVGSLINAVVAAESVAVSGGSVTLQPVDRAAVAVAALDQRYGDELRTHVLWAAADTRIQQLHSRLQAAPSDVFASFSDVTALLLSLTQKVGATSGLGRDEHAEVASLQDAAGRQLPSLAAAVGRYADLVVLGRSSGSGSGSSTGSAATPALGQIADERAQANAAAAATTDDVNNASESSPSAAISPDTLTRLDQLGVKMDALSVAGPAAVGGTDAAVRRLTASATDVISTAAVLSDSMLASIDDLLATRIDAARRGQLETIGVGVLAVLIALVPLIALAVRRDSREAPVAAVPLTTPATPVVRPPLAPQSTAQSGPGQRFAEGAPLPRRLRPQPPLPPSERPGPAPRELMPSTVTHHRRPPGVPDDEAALAAEVAVVSDGWGRSGATG
jgi:hypothetical protein